MFAIPWNRFHFIGYVIAISLVCFIVIMDTLIFFCTMNGFLPIYIRTWRKKMHIYSIVMTLLGITLIIFGLLAITEKYTEDEILTYMSEMWQDRDVTGTKKEAEQFWDKVQTEYTCCGLNSKYNYVSLFPKSCCAGNEQPCTNENAYRSYCFNAVKWYYVNVLAVILPTVAFVMSFICLVLIVVGQFSNRICGFQDVLETVPVL